METRPLPLTPPSSKAGATPSPQAQAVAPPARGHPMGMRLRGARSGAWRGTLETQRPVIVIGVRKVDGSWFTGVWARFAGRFLALMGAALSGLFAEGRGWLGFHDSFFLWSSFFIIPISHKGFVCPCCLI